MGNFYVADGAALTSNDDTWTTPKDFFNKLNKEFNFTLDAAALKSSALVSNYLGPDHDYGWRRDALCVEWDGAGGGEQFIVVVCCFCVCFLCFVVF